MATTASPSSAPESPGAGPAAGRDLDALVRDELFAVASPAAGCLSQEIRRRHGESVAAVLFYGSCLRKETHEGVLDFYVLVDSYRATYRSRALAWANAALPPNVFYIEVESELGPLRSKYAVITTGDFERRAGPDAVRPSIWARFCQPARCLYARDDDARDAVVRSVSRSIVTAVCRALPLMPERFSAEQLWQRVLHETYSAELRTEAPETIRSLFDADPARYRRVAAAALWRLQEETSIRASADEDSFRVEGAVPAVRTPPRWLVKVVYFAALVKSALTFGDWLPYALWKLERHTGTKVVPNERQRRHPFIWGWPLLLRVLWQRDLR